MTKRAIKIIKRDAEPVHRPLPSREEILMQQQKDDAVEERDMANAVQNWISERRENSRIEEVFASRSLFAWDG